MGELRKQMSREQRVRSKVGTKELFATGVIERGLLKKIEKEGLQKMRWN